MPHDLRSSKNVVRVTCQSLIRKLEKCLTLSNSKSDAFQLELSDFSFPTFLLHYCPRAAQSPFYTAIKSNNKGQKSWSITVCVKKASASTEKKNGVKCFRGHQNIADGSINKACWNIWSLLCVQLFNAFKEQLRRFADYHSLLPASF